MIAISILIGLLGLLAFIFDGANLYAQRRVAQIVADEAALAGARALCMEGDVYSAVHNYVSTQKTINLDGWYLDLGSGEITVNTGIYFYTFITKILGGPEMEVLASVKAICSPGY